MRSSHNSVPPLVRGLLGCFALIYAISVVGTLLPADVLDAIRPLDGLVRAGNVAVTGMLTCAGFMAVRELVAARGRSLAGPAFVLVRHLAVILVALGMVVLAVLVVSRYDSTDLTPSESTRTSAWHVLSLQWNTWIAQHPLAARADLSSLWSLSVLAQLLAGLAVAVLLLGRRPRVLGALLVLGIVLAVAWRVRLLGDEGWFAVSLSTSSRADAFLLGALAGLLPAGRLKPQTAAGLCGGTAAVLVGAIVGSSFVTVDELFTVVVPLIGVLVAVFAMGAAQEPDPRTLVVTALGGPDIGFVGALWVEVLAWGTVITTAVERRLPDAPWPGRVLVAAGVLAVVVHVSHRASVELEARVSARLPRVRRKSAREQPGREDRGAGRVASPGS